MVLAGPKGEAAVWHPLEAFLARAIIVWRPSTRSRRGPRGRRSCASARAAIRQLSISAIAPAYALAKARRAPLLFKGEDFAKTDIAPALA